MTADEIAKLTDEQARDAVAKALGWERIVSRSVFAPHYVTKVTWFDVDGNVVAGAGWSPCVDIVDAWPLFEQLPYQTMLFWRHEGRRKKWWLLLPIHEKEESRSFTADTASRVIVNAYLVAHGSGMLRKDGEE
jgi:hypothetical protein